MKVSTFSIVTLVFPVVCLAVVGCRSKLEAVKVSTLSERHLDSVAALRSIAARVMSREVETTVIAMRQDSLGQLVEVARDITRTVTRETETETKGDTAVKRTADKHETKEIAITEAKTDERQGVTLFVAGMWTAFTLLAVGLATILYIKWKSRT